MTEHLPSTHGTLHAYMNLRCRCDECRAAAVDYRAARKQWGGSVPVRSPGRPEVGPAINIRLPVALLDAVDAEGRASGESRAAVIRRILAAALAVDGSSKVVD